MMRKIQLRFKKILNWGSSESNIRVRVELERENIISDGIISGEITKNALKLDTVTPTIHLSSPEQPIQIYFFTFDSVPLGEIEIPITRDILQQQYSYFPLSLNQSPHILQLQIIDATDKSKKALAKDCIDIISQTQELRGKRMEQIEKTNSFIKKREVFLKEWIVKQEGMAGKKKSLSRLMKELSSIKKELKSIDGGSEEEEFDQQQKGREREKEKVNAFLRRGRDYQYSSEVEMKESREESDAHSHN